MREPEGTSPEELTARCTTAMQGLKMHALGVAQVVGPEHALNIVLQSLASLIVDWGDPDGDQVFFADMQRVFPGHVARFRAANQLRDIFKGGAKNDA